MPISASSIERLFKLLDLAESPYISERVRDTVMSLGGCFPSGGERDEGGATLDQIEYISSLAGFDEIEGIEFVDLCREAGGLDINQASFLIRALERQAV